MTNARTLAVAVALFSSLLLQGCYTYPAPTAVRISKTPAEKFETSWQAARRAAYDEGVHIELEDRATGNLRGTQGPNTVTISVNTQADGSQASGSALFRVFGQEARCVGLAGRQ
jgi:hypothetical protein